MKRNYNSARLLKDSPPVPYTLRECSFLHILSVLSKKPKDGHKCTLPWIESSSLFYPPGFVKVCCIYYPPADWQNVLADFCELHLPKIIKDDFIQFLNNIVHFILLQQLSLFPLTSNTSHEIFSDLLKHGSNAFNVYHIREADCEIFSIERESIPTCTYWPPKIRDFLLYRFFDTGELAIGVAPI